MPTMGERRGSAAADPWKRASPCANTPPSAAASQVPFPEAVGAASTIAAVDRPDEDPANGAVPSAKTPPSAVTTRYPVVGHWGAAAPVGCQPRSRPCTACAVV